MKTVRTKFKCHTRNEIEFNIDIFDSWVLAPNYHLELIVELMVKFALNVESLKLFSKMFFL